MRGLILAAVVVGACARPPAKTDTTQAAPPDVVSSNPGVGATPRAETQRPARDTVALSGTGVTLRLDRASYKSGAPVTLRLVNATSGSYAFNPCGRVVDRETGGRWSPVEEQRMCTMIAHILEPRSTRVEMTELPEGLGPGRYRMTIALSVQSTGTPARTVNATSAAFSVAP